MEAEKNYVSLGKEYFYIPYIYYKGIKFYNSDYIGTGEGNITLLKF